MTCTPKVRALIWLALAIWLANGSTVRSEEIWLRDGGWFRGDILEVTTDRVVLSSDMVVGGRMELKLSEIEVIVSDTGELLRIGQIQLAPIRTALEAADLRVPFAVLMPPAAKPTPSKGNVLISGRVTDGNTNTTAVTASGDYEFRIDKNRVSTRAAFNYTEDEDRVSARNSRGSLKVDRFYNKRVFGFVNSLFENDSFADVRLRSTVGCGLGYQFVDPKLDDGDDAAYEELGVSYVHEDVEGAESERYTTLRASGKYEWKLLDEQVELFHFHEVYQSLEKRQDINLEAEVGVRVKVIGKLFTNFQVNFKWDNTPNTGSERDDIEYLWGLGYSFKF